MDEYRLFKVIRTVESRYFDIEYVRDVVMCKECKHWYGESEMYEDREYKKCWQLQGQYMNSDFWCKYGERKGDE